MAPRRRSALSLLNPFARIERGMQDARTSEAIAVVEALRPELADPRPAWFGGGLDGDTRARYVAVGYLAAPDQGIAEGRAFVVDIRSGHVIWQRRIERRSELPRTVAGIVSPG